MREQLIQYVNLLFAGASDCEEMRAEILQNTLDRYDDLVAQGKSPEAAYRLAISGIGDINEILGAEPQYNSVNQQSFKDAIHEEVEDIQRKKMRAVAIALYILCFIPLFILSDLGLETIGLSLTIVIAAAATYLMLITGKQGDEKNARSDKVQQVAPQWALKKSIRALVGAVTLAVYLLVSFATGAWYITWLIFPITGCIKGLVNAIIDLKEACKNED